MQMYLGIDFRFFLLLLYLVLLVNAHEEAIKEDAKTLDLNDEKVEDANIDDSNIDTEPGKDSLIKETSEPEHLPNDRSDALKQTMNIHSDSVPSDTTNDIDINAENINSEKDNIANNEQNYVNNEETEDQTDHIKQETGHLKTETEPESVKKGTVLDETETKSSEEETNEEGDPIGEEAPPEVDSDDEDSLRPLEITKVRVVQDNITGHKRSSFSEDKSENRGDELTVSQLAEEAESRILEKEMNSDHHPSVSDSVEVGGLGENIDEFPPGNDDGEPPPGYVEEGGDNKINGEDLVLSKEGKKVEPNVLADNIMDESAKTHDPYDKSLNDDENSDASSDDGAIEVEFKNLDQLSYSDSADGSKGETDKIKGSKLGWQKMDKEDNAEKSEEIPDEFLSDDESIVDKFLYKSEAVSNKKVDVAKDVAESISLSDEVDNALKKTKEKVKNDPDKGKKKHVAEKVKEQPGGALYEEAINLLKVGKRDVKKAYKLLAEAAQLNNTDAAEKISYPYMFGDHIRRNKTKAVEIFHTLAEQGLPHGQQGLGFIYGAGLNVNSSQAKALIYTTFAALGGDAMAQMMLGYRYFNGIGVAKSCESALTHYKKVAKKVTDETTSHGGNAVQRIRLYDELEQPGGSSGQIDEDLLQYYQFLADKGDLQAQVGLGQLYFQGGRGIDVNYEKAFKYFQLAGDVDNGNGLAYLGKMYLDGLHVVKDLQKAYEYFTKAADQANPIGQAGLGMIYLKGSGVNKDYDQAMKYFSLAAEQGWMEGQLQLGNMYYTGIGVKKDYRQAVKYFTFASQSGHVMAFYNLASMHATGAGVMRSCNTATELFKNVAERGRWSMMFMDAYDAYRAGDLETALLKYYYLAELGYEVAQSNVAYILEKGEMTWFSQNQTFARSLLQWSRAAHQGYAVARVKVGDYHFYGYGTKVDYDTAALHYRMASDQQNNPQAMFNLGYMHEQGFGLKEDIHLAKRFYDMAAEASPDAHIPVTLALLKLTWYFTWEWLQKVNYRFWDYGPVEKWWLYVLQKLGPDWDMYLITALAILLGGILLFRRNLRRGGNVV